MFTAAYCRTLGLDPECEEAISWLAERQESYPAGGYTPPLKRTDKVEDGKTFVAVSFRCRRARRGTGAAIKRVDTFDGSTVTTIDRETSESTAGAFASAWLSSRSAGSILVCYGVRRRPLELLLETWGPALVGMGYSLYPVVSSGRIASITIRRAKRRWTLTYWETLTGLKASELSLPARPAGESSPSLATTLAALYRAIVAASDFVLSEFGVALRATAGMTALACARRFLPPGEWKWRPDPLLVAMERLGKGYRGGLQYAQRYRGKAWRVDVNRQYTAALATELPLRTAFGTAPRDVRSARGVFVCRVRPTDRIAYPLGVWRGPHAGFRHETTPVGPVLCVLHSSEFPGLLAAGWEVVPLVGFRYLDSFNLSGYVERLQSVVRVHGRASLVGKLSKVLGNYVYGKFGQRPDRLELLYSLAAPDDSWYPYVDIEGHDWPQIWERTTHKVTASQHVDIAATITGHARSQTALMWVWLSHLDVRVVRVHTDSITANKDLGSIMPTSTDVIGGWKLESDGDDTLIATAAGYVDGSGAHLSGVAEPTIEDIERLYDGHVTYVVRNENLPLRGWKRETAVRQRRYQRAI